jgi:hypothetical protein
LRLFITVHVIPLLHLLEHQFTIVSFPLWVWPLHLTTSHMNALSPQYLHNTSSQRVLTITWERPCGQTRFASQLLCWCRSSPKASGSNSHEASWSGINIPKCDVASQNSVLLLHRGHLNK